MLPIAIDFESHLIDELNPAPKPVCLSFYDGIHDPELITGLPKMHDFLAGILSNPETFLIAHNAKFEWMVIVTHFPDLYRLLTDKIESGQFFCTMLYQRLLNNISKKPVNQLSLAGLVSHYFAEDISHGKKADAWRTRYSELEDVPQDQWPEEAIQYALDDSLWTFKLWLEMRLSGNNPQLDFAEAHTSQFYLNLMAKSGIPVDTGRVYELEREINAYLEPSYKALEKSGLCYRDEKTGNYKKAMLKFRQYIEDNIPKEHLLYTAKGTLSTTSAALSHYLLVSGDENIEQYLNLAEYEKVKTAFISNLKAATKLPDPLIRTEYNAVVSSGRTSSHKSKFYPSVNIQQMPRKVKGVHWDVRNCFVPRDGWKMVSIDYNGLELCSVANQLKQLYRKSAMANVINGGDRPIDMHSAFACRLYNLSHTNVSYDHFVKHKKEKPFSEYRQLAKPINLGFPGGIGYATMRDLLLKSGIKTEYKILTESDSERYMQNLCRRYKFQYPNIRVDRLGKTRYALVYDELVGLKQELFRMYPDLEQFLSKTHEKFLTGEFLKLKNEFGEWEWEPMYKFYVNNVQRDWCTYTALCNGFMMQTPAAIGAKAAMNKIIKTYFCHPDVRPLAFIHDELLAEVRNGSELEKHIEDLATILIEEMQKTLPYVRIAVEASLMDYWSKDESLWDKTYWKDAIK